MGIKPIVYLRSDGYGEYKAILGKIGPVIYHIMFTIVASFANLIRVRFSFDNNSSNSPSVMQSGGHTIK